MNWVDLVIALLLIFSIIRCWHAGIVQLILAFVGLILGLAIGSFLVQLVAPFLPSQLTKVLLLLVVELSLAPISVFIALKLSRQVHIKFMRLNYSQLNDSVGSVIGSIALLFSVWLLASVLINVTSFGIAKSVSHSRVIKGLDAIMPPPPDVFARLERVFDPNGLPDVFLGIEPQHTTVSAKNVVKDKAIAKAEASVVKIQGAGCKGIVSGTGFVVAPHIVVTNAHVLAGVGQPQVVDRFKSYWATPIVFDQKQDFALLYVVGLSDPPLNLSTQKLPDLSAAVISGFNADGPQISRNVVVIDNLTAIGRDIYNAGSVDHNIYEIQGNIEPGFSGGPLLAPDGSVSGVIFGRSVSQDDVGYALLIGDLQQQIEHASPNSPKVSTGKCAAGIVEF